MKTTMETRIYDWFKENHGDDYMVNKINQKVTFAGLENLMQFDHPDDIIFKGGVSDTTAREWVLDCLDTLKEERYGEERDRIVADLDSAVNSLMPVGWSLRGLYWGVIYLDCKGIASALNVYYGGKDGHPNDYQINVVGAGSFYANQPSDQRNYYLGVAELLTNKELHEAIIKAFKDAERLDTERTKEIAK